MLLGLPNAQARNSAASYDNKYYSQQEFVAAYNDSTGPMYRDYVVGLDTLAVGATTLVNPNVSLGQYITEATSSTTDNINVFGVIDDSVIPAGQLGRVCIRGPHKVQAYTGNGAAALTIGQVVSQCKNNTGAMLANGLPANALNGGVACPYSTATGTAGGMIGYVLNATTTTDTGDAGQTTNTQSNTTGSEYWAWIDPQVLR